MVVHQVEPLIPFPGGDGRPVAMLCFTPDDLHRHYGLLFKQGSDDFDEFLLAATLLSDGSEAWLFRYAGDVPDTTVYIDAAQDAEAALAMLRDALSLEDADFTWITPYRYRPVQTPP